MKAMSFRILLVSLFTILSACATSQRVADQPKRFFWPPEPDEPRIEWIAAYNSDLDIKESTFMSAVVGDTVSVELKRPVSVAGDGEGRFVVSDQELNQVFMFNLNIQQAMPIGGSAEAVDLKRPSGVAVDRDGNFFVGDMGTRKVFVVSGNNKILRVLDLSPHVQSIGNLTVDRARATLVIPDAKGNKVASFSLAGELRSVVEGKGKFSYPNAVAVASDGSLFVADSYNATIAHISPDGKLVKKIGKRGDSAGDLTLVTGVAVDSEDHLYATDARMHNVTIFDKDGNILLVVGGHFSIGGGNIGRGGFQIPQAISVDKTDRIYVADSFNRRVQVLQYLNQRYLAEHPIVNAKP